MKKTLVALSVLWGLHAVSQTPAASCEAQAAERKLAGAAKASFIKKCERDAAEAAPHAARETCEKAATEKKLAGAARNSFVKKCEKDAAAAK